MPSVAGGMVAACRGRNSSYLRLIRISAMVASTCRGTASKLTPARIGVTTIFGSEHMYLCICNAITERDVENHLRQGVATLEELRDRLGIADGCGGCREDAERLLRRRLCPAPG